MPCKILTWNINGLNSPNKRKIVSHWLKKQKVDIICLQETHVRKQDRKLLENKKLGAEFYFLSNKKVKGIVCYVNKDLQPTEIFSDNDGGYLALEIYLNKKKTLLIRIYAPNDAKEMYFKEINRKIQGLIYEQIIVLGDFNGFIDPLWDRSAIRKGNKGKLPKSFFQLLDQENLIDIWRSHNLNSREYTHLSARHKTNSRIDMILVSKNLATVIKKVEILPRIIADHNPVVWTMKNVDLFLAIK